MTARLPVQCAGCPDETLVTPGRPGHRDDCEECQRHCVCSSAPSGGDAGAFYEDEGIAWDAAW